jgi:type II pantothenate kinase
MEGAIDLIKSHGLNQHITKLYATGGGAQKFKDVFKQNVGIEIIPLDELGTIVKALSFLVSQNPQEIYQLTGLDNKHTASTTTHVPVDLGNNNLYPYMLCNIGSGVSILHVNSKDDYKRVSGTALGGGTFFGLAKLLTKLKSFKECMEEAAVGDETTVNMLVKDIYGGRYGLELPGDFTASFFGKVGGSKGSGQAEDGVDQNDNNSNGGGSSQATKIADDGGNSPSPANADLCRALVVMITQNIAQIALLNAVIHGCPRVIFTGNFLRMNPIATRTLAYATKRWSESSSSGHNVDANFLWHEGHLGAIGSYLENLDLEYFLQNQRKRKSPSLDTDVRIQKAKTFNYGYEDGAGGDC